MSKKPAKTTEQDKPQTKYDRKMEARRKEAAREKRNSIIFRTICIIILAGIIGTAGYFSIKQYLEFHTATTEAYAAIGEHEITKLEYDYYFNSTVNNYVNTYSYFLSYMGLDTTKPFEEQQYSEDMTWQEYFEQMTFEQLQREYALIDDAKATGFEYDTTEDYSTFIDTAKEAAKNNQITMMGYYKAMFGDYATANNVKPLMENSFIAQAYYDKLMEDNTPAEDVVSDYYEEHKEDYDQVSFYSFSFDPANIAASPAGTEDDNTGSSEDSNTEDDNTNSSKDSDAENNNANSSEDPGIEDDNANSSEDSDSEDGNADSSENKTAAYSLAEEMKERLERGEDFETLCTEYAPEEQRTNYESTDTEYSLSENTVCSQTNQIYQEWLSDESRKAGDITIIQAEDSGICYVLKFVSRTYDETCLDTISTNLATEAVAEYIDALLENNYEVKDMKGEIAYLSKTTEDTTGTDTDNSDTESLLNTSESDQ